MSHSLTVAAMYEAFGRGDIPAIVERLAPDVAWDHPQQSVDVEWLKARDGREGALAFFQSLADLEFHRFDVKAILEGPDMAIGVVDVETTVKSTGQRVLETDEIHLWRFNAQGQVTSFRHRLDTHRALLAARGG